MRTADFRYSTPMCLHTPEPASSFFASRSFRLVVIFFIHLCRDPSVRPARGEDKGGWYPRCRAQPRPRSKGTGMTDVSTSVVSDLCIWKRSFLTFLISKMVCYGVTIPKSGYQDWSERSGPGEGNWQRDIRHPKGASFFSYTWPDTELVSKFSGPPPSFTPLLLCSCLMAHQ